MEVIITTQDSVTTARLIGRLDTPAAQEVSQAVEPLMAAADGTIVLDCREMTYISSSGLRIFLTLKKVIVKGISDNIRQVFMMTGFLNLFEIED